MAEVLLPFIVERKYNTESHLNFLLARRDRHGGRLLHRHLSPEKFGTRQLRRPDFLSQERAMGQAGSLPSSPGDQESQVRVGSGCALNDKR